MRKTKIICTLGPATDDPETVKQLMESGMDVARFNFSHETHEKQGKRFDMVTKVRDELGFPVATMLDTKGPEIRLGVFENGKVVLEENEKFILTTDEVLGNNKKASISYKNLPKDVNVGTKILVNDGLIVLDVIEIISDKEIVCKIIDGGVVSDRKSVNVPSIQLSLPYMNDVDKSDLRYGMTKDFDYIAASFVRNANDIIELKEYLNSIGGKIPKIISKIENAEGVSNIDEILAVSDGIMVARGDLGVEIPFENIPSIQKELIKKSYLAGKIVITATQMLESMINNPVPTRAEVSDVANAIYEGTSAIMLSGETAMGKHPILAVSVMARVAVTAEANIDYKTRFDMRSSKQTLEANEVTVTDAIAHATCTTSYDLHAKAIISVTKSGHTAEMVSKYRPSVPILGCTPDISMYRQLSLCWGIIPVLTTENEDSETPIKDSVEEVVRAGHVSKGDLVVITAGLPFGVIGSTNMLRVHIIGDESTLG